MAKRRMNAWMRDTLKAHVKTHVQPTKQRKAMDAAYKAAEKPVLAIVHAKWPVKEMAVLAKHKVHTDLNHIQLRFENGDVRQFEFIGDKVPLRPDYYEASRQILLADPKVQALVEAYEDAKAAYEAERKARIDAYVTLIHTSRYVEDLTGVWPEALELLPAEHNVPAMLSPEMLAVVQHDMAERLAA